MNERQKWAVYENEDKTDGKRVPLMNPRFYRLRRGRRGRRERLKSDRVVRKRPLKFRLLRKKSNEIRMNRVSWIGAVAPGGGRDATRFAIRLPAWRGDRDGARVGRGRRRAWRVPGACFNGPNQGEKSRRRISLRTMRPRKV